MPEFIPKANMPDQLARYVLELQRQTPHTGQLVAEGVSQVARSIMDKIKAKKATEAEMSLALAKQKPQEQDTWSTLLSRHKGEFMLKEEPELKKIFKEIGATSLEQLPPTVDNLRLVADPIETSIISPTGQEVSKVRGKSKILPRQWGSDAGSDLSELLKYMPADMRTRFLTTGELPGELLPAVFEQAGIPVEMRQTVMEKVLNWMNPSWGKGTPYAKGLTPEGKGVDVIKGNPKSPFIQKPPPNTSSITQDQSLWSEDIK